MNCILKDSELSGAFIISLDFELFWGVRDKRTINGYGENIKKVHEVIPKILDMFASYGIHATWATVGFLFCANKDEIIKYSPENKPKYDDKNLSPYLDFDNIGYDRMDDPYHYAGNLIQLIKNANGQELATHTFSHYYTLEPGQNTKQFTADLNAAMVVAKKHNISLKSIIFPRNQYSSPYLQICCDYGVKIYRGNEKHWAYAAHNGNANKRFKRLYRLLDAYINLSGHHTYSYIPKAELANLPASRFFRPYSKKLKMFEWLKLRRIYKSMEYAAKHDEVFHLWWHPHNFGSNTRENISNLNEVLQHFMRLQNKYGMQSMNMEECNV